MLTKEREAEIRDAAEYRDEKPGTPRVATPRVAFRMMTELLAEVDRLRASLESAERVVAKAGDAADALLAYGNVYDDQDARTEGRLLAEDVAAHRAGMAPDDARAHVAVYDGPRLLPTLLPRSGDEFARGGVVARVVGSPAVVLETEDGFRSWSIDTLLSHGWRLVRRGDAK